MKIEEENIILKQRLEMLQKYVVVLEEHLKKYINKDEYPKCKYCEKDYEKRKEIMNSLFFPGDLIKSKL